MGLNPYQLPFYLCNEYFMGSFLFRTRIGFIYTKKDNKMKQYDDIYIFMNKSKNEIVLSNSSFQIWKKNLILWYLNMRNKNERDESDEFLHEIYMVFENRWQDEIAKKERIRAKKRKSIFSTILFRLNH